MALTRTETTQSDWASGTLTDVVATTAGDVELVKKQTTILYDDFSADLSKWSLFSSTTAAISGGAVQITGHSDEDRGLTSVKSFGPDGWAQADLEIVSASETWIDITDGTNLVRTGLAAGSVHLQGPGLNINTAYAYSTNTYYTLRLEKVGRTVKAYVNGVEQLSGAITADVNSWSVRIYGWTAAGGANIEVWFDNVYVNAPLYVSSGTRTSPSLDLSPVGIAASSSISWTATTPAGTSVTVETSLDGGATWQQATNGGPIHGINPGDDLTGKSLLVRQTLSTTDTTVTPRLHDLTVTVGSLQTVSASAMASGTMAWNEHIQAVSATAIAGATVGVAAVRMLIQTLMINAVIQPGDIVEIDTAKMTVKINGVNAIQYVDGDFFSLLPGTNFLEYQDSAAQRTVQIITRHRPRWL